MATFNFLAGNFEAWMICLIDAVVSQPWKDCWHPTTLMAHLLSQNACSTPYPTTGVLFCPRKEVSCVEATSSAKGVTAKTWSLSTSCWTSVLSEAGESWSSRTPSNLIFRPSMPPALLNR